MKKLVYLIVAIAALGLIVSGCIPVVPPAEQNESDSIVNKTIGEVEYTNNIIKDEHKIKNKWDLKGEFVAHKGYNWGGLLEDYATWKYSIHIKEAINGFCSVGSIRFTTTATTGEIIEVIGHVKQTKSNYLYWVKYGDPSLAAAGITENVGTTYYFLFLYSERAMWFALSQTPYDVCWGNNSIWDKPLRAYQLHSKVSDGEFPFDCKIIHEVD